ncbi:MAG TPA: DUF5678 domain-containing protein [Patescibacteria group bacterium]|jgi:hypothetical protein|nr:DUF5678 domain-containing protein [Patescibacteria group bacterium]
MKARLNDLSSKLQKYSDEWAVLAPNTLKVVASGKDFNNVMDKAIEKGISNPIVTRAPKNYGAYIL